MPGPATFNTPMHVITYALRNACKLGQADHPSSQQYAEILPRLNNLINFEQTQGLKLFLQDEIALTLVAGTALYSMGPAGNVVMMKPLRVIQGWYQDATGASRRPIDPPISREEYSRLSNIVNLGAISSYFVDKQAASLDVYLWNTPDTAAALGSVHLIVQAQPTQLIGLTDTMTFPLEWAMFLEWALAQQLATGQPQAVISRCDSMTGFYRDKLEGWDVEDAPTRFVPNTQGSEGGSFQ